MSSCNQVEIYVWVISTSHYAVRSMKECYVSRVKWNLFGWKILQMFMYLFYIFLWFAAIFLHSKGVFGFNILVNMYYPLFNNALNQFFSIVIFKRFQERWIELNHHNLKWQKSSLIALLDDLKTFLINKLQIVAIYSSRNYIENY